jgi:transaldolase
MALFLDSAVIAEANKASGLGFIRGATTNPTLLIKAGHTDFYQALEILCSQFNGPVFYQLTTYELDDMNKEYLEFRGIAENLGFKIPCTLTGLQFAASISKNSTVAVTSIFNPSQAYLAAQTGARYVIPYVNRTTRFTGDGIALVKDIKAIVSGTECEVLAAGIKSAAEATAVLLAGSHHVSVPFDLIVEMAENSLSHMAISEFDKNLSETSGLRAKSH